MSEFEETLYSRLAGDRVELAGFIEGLKLRYEREVLLASERAWREGYYTGKRDYAGSVTGGVPISTPNPYSEVLDVEL